jgi:hypothetical protein
VSKSRRSSGPPTTSECLGKDIKSHVSTPPLNNGTGGMGVINPVRYLVEKFNSIESPSNVDEILDNDSLYINKDDLLDIEIDDDHFDEMVPENPIESIINGTNGDWDSEPDSFKIDYIIESITN